MNKTALICGVSGQDGAFLASLLLSKGYSVVGTSRDPQTSGTANLSALGIDRQVGVRTMAPTDFRSVLRVVDAVEPTEIYNLSGQSSVGLSFDFPVETLASHATATLNLLEVIRYLNGKTRLYNAISGEVFGNTEGQPATETTPFRPRSPYGVAKAAAYWQSVNYREAYGVPVSCGILFNHESPLRPVRFVTRKIVRAACQIADGCDMKLVLGDLSVRRDWGWAPEYVEAMWRMTATAKPDDFVIATGESRSLKDFVRTAFEVVGLDWQEHVVTDSSLFRPLEIRENQADPSKAARLLDWSAKTHMEDVVVRMIQAERRESETA